MYYKYQVLLWDVLADMHCKSTLLRHRASAMDYLGRSCSMKHKVYTVFDQKAQVYMQPFYMRADGEATRAFRASIAKPGHPFSDYPADYTLFAIGEYDDDNARFTQYDAFVNLGNGVQHLPEVSNG